MKKAEKCNRNQLSVPHEKINLKAEEPFGELLFGYEIRLQYLQMVLYAVGNVAGHEQFKIFFLIFSLL